MDTYDFDQYLDHLAPALAHADRVSGLKDYCSGLMLPLDRKSVEPLAAHLDPLHVSAKHQAMLHLYAVGVGPATGVWAPGTTPPRPYGGRGIRPTALQRGPGHEPVAVKELALQLTPTAWHTVAWREGTNTVLSSRFALLRVRPAHRDYHRSQLRAEVWLHIEWPDGEDEPTKYWLSNLAADMAMEQLVATAKMRWRIERDYEELKQEFGLGHYEGRGWRGFHHHVTLCIAADGFLLGQRLRQKKALQRQALALPESYRPSGAGARAASRA